ncbi:hypothetical protein [Streptomyces daghestanicus]|uniref:Plasmid transfer protein TraB n=1 Tax=Streptomyces daghestanicus TaxID=66885 RepID=A0ABQ3Q7G9_9ACTN|nr:hypothetical protein [Streptomyces daghestanicus]GGU66495.1 plasmid transfer protein TraB [Streptomyces daghestanicus]GHI33218.1 plasmid transfer protein TraB [Streptomyces daghestanicus]
MSRIVSTVAGDGANNGYTALVAKFTALQHAASALLEEAERMAHRMRANADAAVTVADLCAAAEVDSRHVAAVADISVAFSRVAGGYQQVMSTADTLHTAAGRLKSEHRAEYGGIHAAATSSRAKQAKPGFYQQT